MHILFALLLMSAADTPAAAPDSAAWQKCMSDYRKEQMAQYRLPRTQEVLQHCPLRGGQDDGSTTPSETH